MRIRVYSLDILYRCVLHGFIPTVCYVENRTDGRFLCILLEYCPDQNVCLTIILCLCISIWNNDPLNCPLFLCLKFCYFGYCTIYLLCTVSSNCECKSLEYGITRCPFTIFLCRVICDFWNIVPFNLTVQYSFRINVIP